MRPLAALPLAVALAAGPLSALAAPPERPRAEGRIATDEGEVEILGRTWRAGDTIQLPEGFLRVEEDGPEDREVGSFTVVAAARPEAEAEASLPPAPRLEGTGTGGAPEPAPAVAAPPAPGPACRAERSAYLAELWRMSGIEVSEPGALLEGLEGSGAGPRAGFYWFALQTDPFRPLAWSSDLRARAEALSRCVRGG